MIPGTSSHPAIPGNNDQVDISFENCSLKRLHHYNMFSLMFFKLYHYHIFSLVCIQNFPPHVWNQCGDDRRFCNCGWHCPWCLHWVEEIIFKSQCHIVTMSQCHNVIMTQCRNVTLYLGLTLGKIDYIPLTMSYWVKGFMRWPHNFSFGIDANHLITCSFMAAPCSLAVSKLFYPETEQTKTAIEV